MSYIDKNMLKNRFHSMVADLNEKAGTHLDSRCEGLVERLLDHGIERMSISNVLDRADKQQLAKDNLEKFVGQMEKHARSEGTFPSLGMSAFERAKRESGPMWPFY